MKNTTLILFIIGLLLGCSNVKKELPKYHITMSDYDITSEQCLNSLHKPVIIIGKVEIYQQWKTNLSSIRFSLLDSCSHVVLLNDYNLLYKNYNIGDTLIK